MASSSLAEVKLLLTLLSSDKFRGLLRLKRRLIPEPSFTSLHHSQTGGTRTIAVAHTEAEAVDLKYLKRITFSKQETGGATFTNTG